MKLAIAGLWHLGCVTSACCAKWFDVVAYDEDAERINNLSLGKAPLFEPGLNELISEGLADGKLRFTNHGSDAFVNADVLWITYDTPVDDNDVSDSLHVLDQIRTCATLLRPGATVLISSQLPVGSCGKLEAEFGKLTFAYIPENLQLGKAIQAFESPARIVVGSRSTGNTSEIGELLGRFSKNIIWMQTESAEMLKHALNSFLALSITFINEIATICEKVGADAKEVAGGLKSDMRIGQRAYLSPGAAFAGGTLARDIATLIQISAEQKVDAQLLRAVKASNDSHRNWAIQRLRHCLGDLTQKKFGILGLTYKPGTDTTRRSPGIELCRSLRVSGAYVTAMDPCVKVVPGDDIVRLVDDSVELAQNSDALVICTEWPEFRQLDWPLITKSMRRPLILDPNRFLESQLANINAEYLSVGRS